MARTQAAIGEVGGDAVQTVRVLVEDTVETIPGLGAVVRGVNHWVIDKTTRAYLERTRAFLKELYRDGKLKEPYELSELLPWMLAQDLNHHINEHPDERLVLFIDEYERVFDEGGAGARWPKASTIWLRISMPRAAMTRRSRSLARPWRSASGCSERTTLPPKPSEQICTVSFKSGAFNRRQFSGNENF